MAMPLLLERGAHGRERRRVCRPAAARGRSAPPPAPKRRAQLAETRAGRAPRRCSSGCRGPAACGRRRTCRRDTSTCAASASDAASAVRRGVRPPDAGAAGASAASGTVAVAGRCPIVRTSGPATARSRAARGPTGRGRSWSSRAGRLAIALTIVLRAIVPPHDPAHAHGDVGEVAGGRGAVAHWPGRRRASGATGRTRESRARGARTDRAPARSPRP